MDRPEEVARQWLLFWLNCTHGGIKMNAHCEKCRPSFDKWLAYANAQKKVA